MTFFKTVSQDISQEYLSIYDDVEQQFIQAKTGGGVSIQFPEVTMDATEYAEWNLEKFMQPLQN